MSEFRNDEATYDLLDQLVDENPLRLRDAAWLLIRERDQATDGARAEIERLRQERDDARSELAAARSAETSTQPDGQPADTGLTPGSTPRAHFTARDANVITDLRANTYPYGAGHPDHGIQITLKRDEPPAHDPTTQVVRLPHPVAVEFAHWILATYEAGADQ
jgi:hypothetical protein